jgi:hypothetical protein
MTVQKPVHLKLPAQVIMRQFCPEGVFLDVIGTTVLRLNTFAPCYSQSPPPADFTPPPPPWFFGLELKVDGGLALFTLSLCSPLKVALSFYYYSSFIYKYIFSP